VVRITLRAYYDINFAGSEDNLDALSERISKCVAAKMNSVGPGGISTTHLVPRVFIIHLAAFSSGLARLLRHSADTFTLLDDTYFID
jgi:hypothetical protein